MYNRLSDLQFKDGALLIEEVLKPQGGEWILDLGCGTGRTSMILASRVGRQGRILGIDPQKNRVQVAQETAITSGIKQAAFMDGTCADAISRGPFDAVFSNYVLHWIQDQFSVLQDVYKCLRPGGRFAFLTVADCPALFRVVGKGLLGSEDIERVLGQKYGDAHYWGNLCKEVGFIVDWIENKATPHIFPDAISVYHLARATVPSEVATMRTPKKKEVLDWLKPFTDKKTGQISYQQPVVRALVRKPRQSSL